MRHSFKSRTIKRMKKRFTAPIRLTKHGEMVVLKWTCCIMAVLLFTNNIMAALLSERAWEREQESSNYMLYRPSQSHTEASTSTLQLQVSADRVIPEPTPISRVVSYTRARPTQAQKNATEQVCERVSTSRRDMLEEINVSHNLFMTTCYYDLLAMAHKESGFNNKAVGDQGRSHGPFQIQVKMHKITVEQAQDYEFAAEWTMDRMVRDTKYPYGRTNSIRRHNGSGQMAANYAESVKQIASKFKNDKI